MSDIEKIRSVVLDGGLVFTDHAVEELGDDDLDRLDVHAAILTGRVDQRLTHDPRGVRYVIIGTATDLTTKIAAVVRFESAEKLLVITAYELTD